MRRTIYEGTGKLLDSCPNSSDPRTLSYLNLSESVPNMTSNYTFLLNPSYPSTNLNDKHYTDRLGLRLTNPRNNFGRRNDNQVELMPSSTFLPFFRLALSSKSCTALFAFPKSELGTHVASFTWYPCHFTKYSVSRDYNLYLFKIVSTSHSSWFPTSSDTRRNTRSRFGLIKFSKYSLSNETWNTGYTLISGGNANL